MLYKSKLTLVAIIFSFTSAFSQDAANYSASKKQINNSKNLFTDLSISINYGITKFNGDISQYPFFAAEQKELGYQDSDFQERRFAFSFSLEKKIDKNFSISIENISGEFAGLRRPNEYKGNKIHVPYSNVSPGMPGYFDANSSGDKFVNSFNETDILLNFNINSTIARLTKKEMPENFSIIFKIGFGYNEFRSLRTDLYNDNYIYSFGYGELTKNESNDPVSESVMVMGTKLEYKFVEDLSLILDYTIRLSNSDKWDSSIMEGGQGRDRFSFLSFGLAYDLGAVNKTKD